MRARAPHLSLLEERRSSLPYLSSSRTLHSCRISLRWLSLLLSGTDAEVSRAQPIFIALSEGPQFKVSEQVQQLKRKFASFDEA